MIWLQNKTSWSLSKGTGMKNKTTAHRYPLCKGKETFSTLSVGHRKISSLMQRKLVLENDINAFRNRLRFLETRKGLGSAISLACKREKLNICMAEISDIDESIDLILETDE